MAVSTSPSVERFGHLDCEWSFDSDADPATVAAAHRQHLLVLAARKTVGRSFSAAEVARHLSVLRGQAHLEPTPAAVRKASRWLSGDQAMTRADELEWCAAFDLHDTVATWASRLDDPATYPAPYASALAAINGSVTFRDHRSVHWPMTAATLSRRLDADLDSLTPALITSSVVRAHVAHAVIEQGFNKHLLQHTVGGVHLLATPVIRVAVRSALFETDRTYPALVQGFVTPPECEIFVTAMSEALWVRLSHALLGNTQIALGSNFTVPPSVYHNLGIAMPAEDSWWHVESVEVGAFVRVLVAAPK